MKLETEQKKALPEDVLINHQAPLIREGKRRRGVLFWLERMMADKALVG